MANVSKPQALLSYDEVVTALKIKVLPPEDNDNFFKNIIGLTEPLKHLSQVLELLKNPDDPKNKKATLNRKIIFLGANGVGKTMTAYAFAKEANMPITVINCEKFVTDKPLLLIKSLGQVFEVNSPCVVLFKDLEYITKLSEKESFFIFSKICDYINTYTNCTFFCTVSNTVIFPDFLLGVDGFSFQIVFNLPDITQRTALIQRFLDEYPHTSDIDITKIAKNTLGLSPGNLITLFKSAYNLMLLEDKTEIDYITIDAILSSKLYGGKVKTMTEKERKLTAYHEAGHVIAGYYSNPEYKLSKVEIVHRTESLGLTVSEIDEEKLSYTKEDLENNIILSYGGMAAERLILGTNTSGVFADLISATVTAELMVKQCGMNEEFGPIHVDSTAEEEPDFFSPTLAETADLIIQQMLKELYAKTEKIVLANKAALIALSEALLEKETLYSEDILEILKKYPADT